MQLAWIKRVADRYTLKYLIYILPFLFFIISCKEQKQKTNTLFEQLGTDSTNIDFVNKLTYNDQFNIFTYRNYYNGGGVAIGDLNNDGLEDVFFTSNMLQNR